MAEQVVNALEVVHVDIAEADRAAVALDVEGIGGAVPQVGGGSRRTMLVGRPWPNAATSSSSKARAAHR